MSVHLDGASEPANLFSSFFLGGFECSSHSRPCGMRLDLIRATGHDVHALRDYLTLQRFGIHTVRDGIRWHRIERRAGQYSFAADLPLVRAARRSGLQVIWDLCHYGWPADLDPFNPAFARRLAGLARSFVRLLRSEGEVQPYVVPINEISFLSWIGGTVGRFPPFATGRGDELKRSLVRAALECVHAVREAAPRTRFCWVDPVINVVGVPGASAEEVRLAEVIRLAQYTAWDMLSGAVAPELGGHPDFLDIIGVNYYVHNQWQHANDAARVRPLRPRDPRYRPLWSLLAEVHQRYQRPLFIAETGIEGRARARWLRYVGRQVRRAMHVGVPIEGMCLYPILDYPGWDDDRPCPTGLLGFPDAAGARPVHAPLARELVRQQARFERLFATRAASGHHRRIIAPWAAQRATAS